MLPSTRARDSLSVVPILLCLCLGVAACDDDDPTAVCEDCSPIVGLEVAPETVRVEVGAGVRLTARVVHEAGESSAATEVAWTAMDPGVVSVDAAGEVEALASGQAKVAAAARGFVG